MLTIEIGRTGIFHGYIPRWFVAVLAIAMPQLWTRGPQRWIKIRSQWQGRSGAGIHRGNSLAPGITSMLIGKHGLGPFWPLPSLPWTDSVGTVPERNSRGKFSGHLKSSSYCKLNFDATYLLWTVIPKGFQGPALQSENIPKIVQNFESFWCFFWTKFNFTVKRSTFSYSICYTFWKVMAQRSIWAILEHF